MEIKLRDFSYIENKDTSFEKDYFSDVNMDFLPGEIVGVLGEDLDVLGKLIMCIKRPSKGNLILDNNEIKRTSHISNVELLRKKIGYIYDFDNEKFLANSVKNEIALTMRNYGKKVTNEHIIDSLKLVGLNDSYLDRNPNELSYIEKKKLLFACAMSYNPDVLIVSYMDIGLSYREKDYFKKLLNKFKNKYNKTIIIITNKVDFLFDLDDKFYALNKGKVFLSGDKYELYNEKLYKYFDMPKIIEFTKYAKECGHNINDYFDLKELIKEVYRNAK